MSRDLVRGTSEWVGRLDEEVCRTLPEWLAPIARGAGEIAPDNQTLFGPPPWGGRRSAVLMLFGFGSAGPDVLLIERASGMRNHAGQPAFPGGAMDPQDDGPVGAALREAQEETGLDPAGVQPIGTLSTIWVPPSGFLVTPVIAWWREPTEVSARIAGEVSAVHRVPLAELIDPANRVKVRHPSGYVGHGFEVRGMLVWGFTGGLLSRVLSHSGLARPWEPAPIREIGPG